VIGGLERGSESRSLCELEGKAGDAILLLCLFEVFCLDLVRTSLSSVLIFGIKFGAEA
jgi:hypothetical protein